MYSVNNKEMGLGNICLTLMGCKLIYCALSFISFVLSSLFFDFNLSFPNL